MMREEEEEREGKEREERGVLAFVCIYIYMLFSIIGLDILLYFHLNQVNNRYAVLSLWRSVICSEWSIYTSSRSKEFE